MTRLSMNKQKIDKIFEIWKEDHKNDPIIELSYINNYTLIVAIILSAQTTDAGVNKATPALFKVADTPEKMVKLGEEKLKEYIKTIGLYNTKAKNVIKMSQELVEKHGSEVPDDFDKLIKLPGVGRKTANVFLNVAFDKNTIGVDTHVHRVSNRLGIVKTDKSEQTETELNKKIPEKWKRYVNHWMVLHGRYVCKSQKPKCSECCICDLCEFKGKSV